MDVKSRLQLSLSTKNKTLLLQFHSTHSIESIFGKVLIHKLLYQDEGESEDDFDDDDYGNADDVHLGSEYVGGGD